MKSLTKKTLVLGAAALSLAAISSKANAYSVTEQNRYRTAPAPYSYVYVTNPEVKNVDIYGNVIITEGTDFSQYYWRGDSQQVTVTYENNTYTNMTQTVRYWEAK
ncbi:hypothetical protein ACVR0S_02505 [Streptococcus dentapri]|uniref:Uncharacterized protein n=1 Tax=Streptococcus dentapri TaxID=573564 RepID=A0ABV8D2X5_9STRE